MSEQNDSRQSAEDRLKQLSEITRQELQHEAIRNFGFMARGLFGAYQGFREAGFSDEQAFELTRDMLRKQLESSNV